MSLGNQDLEQELTELPEIIEKAKIGWLIAKLEREKVDALIHNEIKLRNPELTATELKALVIIEEKHEKAVMKEIVADAYYEKCYENLMIKKKICDLRTAF